MAKASSSGWSSGLSGGADTIVARATAPGPAALAVVRLSGPGVRRIAGEISPKVDFSQPWRARLVAVDGVGGEAVAIAFAAPRSYTGEDMLELTVHGSPFVVGSLVERCIAAGARPAAPGEFSRRAVANGKMDLLQAEAVRDLVRAETAWQARNAREQLGGALSQRLAGLRGDLVELLARLEASLDFADQGVDPERAELASRRERCRSGLASLLATAAAGERIRDGVRVVIVGPPNSGKSTLFNTLLGTERAIVAPHPGTTRDLLEAELEIAGLRVTLVDTAGLHEAADPVEVEGVRRARAAAASATVILELSPADGGTPPPAPAEEGTTIRVLSKADLPHAAPGDRLPVSCATGAGVDRLRATLAETVAGKVPDLGGEVAISRRHRRALERAADELIACDLDHPELGAESLRWAVRELGELLGEVATEDLLDEVFGSFCIGK
ncbi:MAG TPA: tRNA uridine-5-carboxymethylaminomethyl(34) synthesis GTPase MnmE [Thermoanaerobaculales bacterium]|mgnify:CR=1 FL=1|nr:tRNA uridine-5-carboxymethylaminomethyl(34) synthesis GTPase MnmE [Thermoanaerobaculales bacterium]HPA82782.1 tRNA uridine-5-carboxymethylaminomethyl(34) synthesis GTPase MnmE [Thermoanaerobaculales bacterium]HQL31239.1 tRNA uridine-5-carboxymethylaminomethyl(34) synthesis GTPase MnmE [Thermoanaerobaculales bacterium]HQN95815.1 tRNA uridine-5-carboxymethylaminomethyl(34) synthesis GTPase MnmE [Thermoanaerobaculales bacterium]